jgi:hypothetical protein
MHNRRLCQCVIRTHGVAFSLSLPLFLSSPGRNPTNPSLQWPLQVILPLCLAQGSPTFLANFSPPGSLHNSCLAFILYLNSTVTSSEPVIWSTQYPSRCSVESTPLLPSPPLFPSAPPACCMLYGILWNHFIAVCWKAEASMELDMQEIDWGYCLWRTKWVRRVTRLQPRSDVCEGGCK